MMAVIPGNPGEGRGGDPESTLGWDLDSGFRPERHPYTATVQYFVGIICASLYSLVL